MMYTLSFTSQMSAVSSLGLLVQEIWVSDDGDSSVLWPLEPPQLWPDSLDERCCWVRHGCGGGWRRPGHDMIWGSKVVFQLCISHLPGLAPSDQQVLVGLASSSVDSVLPGSSCPWWRCFRPAASPSQFLCLLQNLVCMNQVQTLDTANLENILSAFQRGSAADQGRAGMLGPSGMSSVSLRSRGLWSYV